MAMLDLPRDLLEDIVSRVPDESLRELRCTCKQWNALFKDPGFTKKTIRQNSKRSYCNEECKARIESGSLFANDYIGNAKIQISDIFHCDGLLLFRTMSGNMLIVWNPCSDKTMYVYPNEYTGSIFALGYHKELCDKVIKGILLLLSFDFTTESFGRMNLPFQRLGYEILALSVVKEEKLSVLQQSLDTSRVEIWVTTSDKIDQTKVSLLWSKFLAVDLTTYCDHRFTCDVSFFIEQENEVAVCWDKAKAYIFGEVHHNIDMDFEENIGWIPTFPAVMCQGWFKFKLKRTRRYIREICFSELLL
ncbi:hypothetical protein ARALYDRAFT_903179 [Arabidopsis lyrata subsp. lyrata]|uniref:F-box domain-containing protein n=1 Tax=Arabidopsis lyrata subsp. lyrata TaxID=81972 RepID=D7LD36_ARALL|nr:hypothetical protein ARALYDRAFT_903179 [Arabidopsis lyrata subsp. lyrata]